MFKWKQAEKLKQPKITEVVDVVEMSTAASAEKAQLASQAQSPAEESLQAPSPTAAVNHIADVKTLATSTETPPELGDRYEVIEFIGSGGMGSVWKVFDKQLKETFAIKVLKPELLADSIAVKRFEKEANLASDLTHANIAAIFGPGTDTAGRPFIIMGYVDGESLADILTREGKLSEERALDIFTQLCEALAHSHMKGIVHRDIKPSNIIISKTESGGDMVHVVDFGIARCVYDEVTKTQALTKAVDIFGSPRYMSPEQFLGSEVTGQSDIYSLGCVFYEMLTGAPPFTDENPVKLILQQISETPDLSKIPNRFKLLIQSCLFKEPESRVQNINHLLASMSWLDDAPFGTNRPINFIHSMCAVFLIFVPGIFEMFYSTTPTQPGPHISIFLLLVWLYVVGINRENVGRSLNYRILEFNLFLTTMAGATISAIGLSHNPLLTILCVCVLSGASLWLLFSSRALDLYSLSISAFTSRLTAVQPKRNFKHLKLVIKSLMMFSSGLTLLLSGMAAFLLIDPILDQVCAGDIMPLLAGYGMGPHLSIFVIICFLILCVRLVFDMLLRGRAVNESLKSSLIIQSCFVLAVVFSCLTVTSTVGKDGLNLFTRQNFSSLIDKKKQEQVRLEALTYPDSPLANRAKLYAAGDLWSSFNRRSDALALVNQIIDSNLENDPCTLASAYYERLKLKNSKFLNKGEMAELEKVLSLIARDKKEIPFDLDTLVLKMCVPHRAGYLALDLCRDAIRLNNYEFGVRALNVAEKYKTYSDYYGVGQISGLRAELEQLPSAPRSISKDRQK
ncbi:hypothetical protein BH11CYA1_BH11CYA1_47350 [soil metagenome]